MTDQQLPCPHGRLTWQMCPHCNGINAPVVAQERVTGHRFKVFQGNAELLEEALNKWAATLPEGTKIRRTQVAAVPNVGAHAWMVAPVKHEEPTAWMVALVNYEEPTK